MKFKENIALSSLSHYKIGGIARFFFEPKNERELAWAVREARTAKLPIFILGGGTNVLFNDSGFYGVVIKPSMMDLRIGKKKNSKKTFIEVGAGVSMDKLLRFAEQKSLSGLEWAGGLPGTVGGAIRGNAGCFGGETKDAIVSVRSLNMKTGKFVQRTARACAFGYRDSVFKRGGTGGAKDEIIISAVIALARGDRRAILKATREKIEYRKKNHPLEHPNIGSIFKNVPLTRVHRAASKEYAAALTAQTLAFRGSKFSIKTDPMPVISAAKLIGESGLRGVSFGGAMISAKHPNFIVNALDASAADVRALMELATAEVKRKFDVDLEPEVQVM